MTSRISPTALVATGLSVRGVRGGAPVGLTSDVDIEVPAGEAVAIVGESGSGKSLTARALLSLLPRGLASSGTIRIGDRDVSLLDDAERRRLRGSELAFVMQDPFTMLNPLERCGSQVTAALRGPDGRRLRKAAARDEAVRRLAEVGIADPAVADRYPFELSGGMRQRVAIAAAIAENPAVLIADEPTTALDVTTQKEILDLLERLSRSHRMGLVLITHDLRVAFSVCTRIYVMYAGEIVEAGRPVDVRNRPRHPYTAGLLRTEPPLDRRVHRLARIPGAVPAPGARPAGCRFAPRCGWAEADCHDHHPALTVLPLDHQVRCRRADELTEQLRPSRTDEPPEPAVACAASDRALIRTRALRRTYGPRVAVAGADIEVHAGESVGLVGESGSGKTTLARMLVGLTRPSSGSVEVGGVDLASRHLSSADWAVVRSTAQMAFQDPYSTLNPHRTIGAALRDGLRLVGAEDIHRRTDELLERVGLSGDHARRMPAQLSGGERQRVAIARALARSPRVLVCDEIVSALDVSVQAHILNLLRDLQVRLGLSLVFITHDLAVARQVTDRIYVLKDGEIVEQGATGDVLDHPRHPYTQRLVASVPSPRPDPGTELERGKPA